MSSTPLSALDGAPVWLNSEPHTAAGLRGRVAEAADWAALRSPETYVGYARAAGLRRPGPLRRATRRSAARCRRTFEITVLDPGVRAYVFTFG